MSRRYRTWPSTTRGESTGNPAAERTFGWSREEVIGTSLPSSSTAMDFGELLGFILREAHRGGHAPGGDADAALDHL